MITKKLVTLCWLLLTGLFVSPIYSSSTDDTNTTSAVMVVSATPNKNEMAAMKYYAQHAKKLLSAAGGKPIGRYKVSEEVYGKDSPAFFIIMEFPNEKAIRHFLNSKEYQKLIPYRDKAFSKLNIFIAEKS